MRWGTSTRKCYFSEGKFYCLKVKFIELREFPYLSLTPLYQNSDYSILFLLPRIMGFFYFSMNYNFRTKNRQSHRTKRFVLLFFKKIGTTRYDNVLLSYQCLSWFFDRASHFWKNWNFHKLRVIQILNNKFIFISISFIQLSYFEGWNNLESVRPLL